MGSLFRKIRGALGNAVVWGVGWFGVGLALLTVASVGGLLPLVTTVGDVLRLAGYVGAAGFATGGAFSLYIAIAYRNRTLADIRPGRFALAGAVIAGAASIVVGGAVLPAAALGGLTGFGTIKLAQQGSRALGAGWSEEAHHDTRLPAASSQTTHQPGRSGW